MLQISTFLQREALRLAQLISDNADELALLERSITARACDAKHLRKSARTHLRDALPITLGRELHAWAVSLERCRVWIDAARRELCVLPLGGGAVGTEFGIPTNYARLALEELNRGREGADRFHAPVDRVEAVQSQGPVALASGMHRLLALELGRIASDLRLLSSGPRAGLHEIDLPAVQPGSSAMPAKVNPSVAEMVNQVCFQVMGCDTTVAMACEAGQLELNVMMPVIAWNALHATTILREALRALRIRCVEGLEVDAERARVLLDRSTATATALSPFIGYEATAAVAQEAVRSGRLIRDLVVERGLLDRDRLDQILSVEAMTRPGIRGH